MSGCAALVISVRGLVGGEWSQKEKGSMSIAHVFSSIVTQKKNEN